MNANCLMDFDPSGKHEWEKPCKGGSECKRCGWNVKVHNARLERIRNGGLKQDSNGLWYLPVPKPQIPLAENPLANLALSLYSNV